MDLSISIAYVHKPRELVKSSLLDFICSEISDCLEIRTFNFCFHPSFFSKKSEEMEIHGETMLQ